jgi:hypothetical protein
MLLFYEFPVVVVSMMMMMLFLRVLFVTVAHSPPYDDHDTGRRTEEKEGESPETGNKRGEPQMDPQNSSFIPKDRIPGNFGGDFAGGWTFCLDTGSMFLYDLNTMLMIPPSLYSPLPSPSLVIAFCHLDFVEVSAGVECLHPGLSSAATHGLSVVSA